MDTKTEFIMPVPVILLIVVLGWCMFPASPTLAETLTSKSDTISNPTPGASSNHTILFTTTLLVPESGKITIEVLDFNVPAALDYTDVDIAINNSEKSLAATPGTGSGSDWGVSVTSGTSGRITVTLNDSNVIAVGSIVRIKIGTNASHSATGTRQITNASSIGSYTFTLATKNSSNTQIDSGDISIALVNPVGIIAEAPNPTLPPPPAPAPPSPTGSGGGQTSTYPPPPITVVEPCSFPPADLNCDAKVNLIDFSILMYYWRNQTPGLKADINKDGIVNLIDFNVLMYWWGY